ncbi:hypothetical protein ACYULU_14935, partial [Breznakiellaceae bacterium SP9]
EGIRMAQEAYSGITQDAHEQARLLSLWKGQMDIQSKMVTAARMTEKAEQGQRKAEQEQRKAEQEREKERQGREKAEQKLAQERERAEQKLAQERERSIAAMRALGMSDKDIDKIYPDK